MFSAFKKLTGRTSTEGNNGVAPVAPPPGLSTMSVSLQKKFSKGVHYNMKIIIKGDHNVGKSQLFRRIQGLPFSEEYVATEEIQVANITWNYKNSDDIVKVEVWDVVDVANRKKRLPSDKLKLENTGPKEIDCQLTQEFALDANTIDVYKNTNGVIFVFDITKTWTYDYVKKEINSVPDNIPILILGNRRDMGHHRAVASDTVLYFIEGLERSSSIEIRYGESSMRNGFGLKYVHKFFNLPYLHLQKAALLKQIEINKREIEITVQELDCYADSEESNYDLFIENINAKRRQLADALSPPKVSVAEAQARASAKALKENKSNETASVASKLVLNSDPSSCNENKSVLLTRSQNSTNGATKEALHYNKGNFGKQDVEDFVPEDDTQINSFLADENFGEERKSNSLYIEESSEEESHDKCNPMVASVVDDIQDLDTFKVSPTPVIHSDNTLINDSGSDTDEKKPSDSNQDKKAGFEIFLENTRDAKQEGEKEKKASKHSQKKAKHKKKKKHGTGTDLEEFLAGGETNSASRDIDNSAYEAL